MNFSRNPNESHTEYHTTRMAFSDRLYTEEHLLPHRYVFVLTNRCNLSCSFCFQDRARIPGSLTVEDWLKVVEQLPDYAWVTLTGGEPFVFKGFETIFQAVTKKYRCNIISNGVLMTESLIDLLLSRPRFSVLSISVDNLGNTVRDIKPEQWQRAEGMMRLFSKRRDAIGSKTILDSKTVVLDTNADDLFEIHKYCMETLTCDTHSFQLLKGSPIQHADVMVPMEAMYNESSAYVYKKFDKIAEQFELVRQYNIRTGKKCFVHPKVVDLNSSVPIEGSDLNFINIEDHIVDNYLACKAPWESIHINVDGNVFPCMAISMGNVKMQSLPEIIHGKRFRIFKNVIKERGTVAGCNRCGYLLPKRFGTVHS